MNIKEALNTAYVHMSAVRVNGAENLKHMLAAMEYVAAVKNTLENAEKEEERHEDDPSEERGES